MENQTRKLQVTHDRYPENEVVINGVWCDIGSHMVNENDMRQASSVLFDANVCEGCYDHYNDSWQ